MNKRIIMITTILIVILSTINAEDKDKFIVDYSENKLTITLDSIKYKCVLNLELFKTNYEFKSYDSKYMCPIGKFSGIGYFDEIGHYIVNVYFRQAKKEEYSWFSLKERGMFNKKGLWSRQTRTTLSYFTESVIDSSFRDTVYFQFVDFGIGSGLLVMAQFTYNNKFNFDRKGAFSNFLRDQHWLKRESD